MENTSQRLKELLHSASWSREDKIWLEQYLSGDVKELERIAQEAFQQNNDGLTSLLTKDESVQLLNNLHQRLNIVQDRKTRLWPRIFAVAAAVAAVVFGIWFYNNELTASRKAPRNDVAYKNDIAPGKNTATLTLPNGKTINLSDAKTGVVIGAMNDTTQLTYNDGSLVRSSLRGGTTRQPHDEIASIPRNDGMMLTAATPRGGQYQFTLPDGTNVWLNAASTLKFPSQFSGANRKILLSGEAYFEVAKDSKHPFVVESDGQDVTVLGTHFNINAYGDEGNTKTTLLEGSVKVTASSLPASSLRGGTTRQPQPPNEMTLKPNQQATVTGYNRITVKTVDANEAIDWKNGEFMFNNEPLENIMKKIARWYDVEVVYQDVDQRKSFWGGVSRYDNISKVLEKLEMTGGVHFKIDGRKVIVHK